MMLDAMADGRRFQNWPGRLRNILHGENVCQQDAQQLEPVPSLLAMPAC